MNNAIVEHLGEVAQDECQFHGAKLERMQVIFDPLLMEAIR